MINGYKEEYGTKLKTRAVVLVFMMAISETVFMIADHGQLWLLVSRGLFTNFVGFFSWYPRMFCRTELRSSCYWFADQESCILRCFGHLVGDYSLGTYRQRMFCGVELWSSWVLR